MKGQDDVTKGDVPAGLMVVLDVPQRKTSHEYPECKWWLDVIASISKAATPLDSFVEVMDAAGKLRRADGKAS